MTFVLALVFVGLVSLGLNRLIAFEDRVIHLMMVVITIIISSIIKNTLIYRLIGLQIIKIIMVAALKYRLIIIIVANTFHNRLISLIITLNSLDLIDLYLIIQLTQPVLLILIINMRISLRPLILILAHLYPLSPIILPTSQIVSPTHQPLLISPTLHVQ